MTMWRARLLGALALAGSSALLAAAPVRASNPNAAWTPSGNRQVTGIPNPAFVVQWNVSPNFLDHITVTPWFEAPGSSNPTQAAAGGHAVSPATCSFPQFASNPTGAVQAGSCSIGGFTPSLNGTYYAESAAYYQCVSSGSGYCLFADDVSPVYALSVPPSAPSLTVSYDASAGRINVSWSHDPNADDETFTLAESVNGDNPATVGLSSPSATSWSRGNLTPGDTYTFVVAADRPQADGSTFPEADSAPQSAQVPAPPPPDSTTTTAGGSGGGGGGGTGGGGGGGGGTTSTTQKLINPSLKPPSNYTPSKLDLSAFAKALSAAKARSGAGSNTSGGDNGSVSGEPDTYKQSLPYGSASPNSATEDGPQQAADSPPLARASTNAKDNVRTAAAVAGGLLAIVLAMHGMWLRSEVKRAALLETVEPEGMATDEFHDFWQTSDGDPWGG